MVQRSLNAYVVMAFGELNVFPRTQVVIVQRYKNTINNITKLESFLNKQIMVFLLNVMLVIGLQPKVYQLNYISFGFVMMTLCVVWEGQT
jgi:hypothetical protein